MAYPDIPMSDLFSRTGGTAAGTDATKGVNPSKLWLPIWSGEVIHAYDQYNKFEGMVDHKTISSGTTMEFPITGTVALKTAWGAGEELSGGTDSTATTFSVKLDARPMAAHFELDNIDLMITQWEYRAELARQAGLTLANARDKQLAAYIARASAEGVLDHDPRGLTPKAPFGHVDYAHLGDGGGDNAETNAALRLLKDCENWMVYLQENDITTEGVYCAVNPATYASIRALGLARANADETAAPADTFARGRPVFGDVEEHGSLGYSLAGKPYIEETLEYMGVTICKTNHMPINYAPAATPAGTAIGEDRYNLKFIGSPGTANEAGELMAMFWQRNAVASLKLQGLKVDTVDDIRRNTVFTVASMMSGTGTLRPECACAVVNTTVTGSGSAADTRAKLRGAWGMSPEYVDSTTYGG
jgi:hypothetical protein